MSSRHHYRITPDILLRAYAAGIFPMADSAEATELHWFDPPVRAIIPLDTFHVPAKLRRTVRRHPFSLRLNTAFGQVIRACAAPSRPDRDTTWINTEIIRLYEALHQRGHAHSIEAWDGEELVGGLYGVSLGGAFFGESMFSIRTDASKIALVGLVTLMQLNGFALLDTQFQTDHLRQFGTVEVTRDIYHHLLSAAARHSVKLRLPANCSSAASFMQNIDLDRFFNKLV